MAVNSTAERLWKRAQQYAAQGQMTAAYISLQSLVRQFPAHTHAHLLLSNMAYSEGRYRDTAQHALDAAEHLPNDDELILRIVLTLLQVGEVVAARACLESPFIARSNSGLALARYASARQMIGDHVEALALLDRAKAFGHDNADFRYIRSVQLTFNGRLKEAEQEIEACLRMGDTYGRASVTLARLRKQTAENNHLADIRQRLERVAKGSEDHAAFEFAQYKELEDIGDYAGAWAALERGSAVMYARLQHDAGRERFNVERLLTLSTPEFLSRPAQPQTGPQPIFIIGMPRSGTTLLDRILGNHSKVVSAGELGDFGRALRYVCDHVTNQPQDETILQRATTLDFGALGRRYLEQTQWRAGDKPFYVDKLPINWLQAGFIRRALPQARILHMTRDAMDVCFSNYRAFFGVGYAYSYNLDALVSQFQDYRRAMSHWHRAMPGQILDVAYDDLVSDTESVARTVLDFCGLDFESSCVDMHRNEAPVATLSAMQVREPIHQRSRNEWMRYERQLAPLQARLAE